MKRSLQDQANDPVLWEVLKRKFEKSSTSNTSYRDDDIHSQRHDDHQEDDAHPEEEKRVKRHKASKSSKYAREETVIDDDEVISKDETPELITELQNIDKHVPTIFDCARMEATLNDMLSNHFNNAEEYAYHLEQTINFIENQIVDIVKFCDATMEKVLKEVMLKIFQSEPWKKPPLLGELDRDISAFRKGMFSKLWRIKRSIVLAEYDGPKMVDSAMITIVIELLDAMNKLALFLRKSYTTETWTMFLDFSFFWRSYISEACHEIQLKCL
ncbi:hypothetical protein Tco_0680674 [Tanacetum coccineum]|uniref:Uncharacterized protein n=1 Tax=Tanacetum coccineum TaxID=301880 RepID=A0ABQ4XMB8_9ASTR